MSGALPISEREPQVARTFPVTHRAVLAIALPMTFSLISVPLTGIVDTTVAGQLGSASALAGLAVASVLFDLLFATVNFLRSSTTGLVAQAYGRRDAIAQRDILLRALALALLISLPLLLFAPFLFQAGIALMQPDPPTERALAEFMRLRFLSIPAALLISVFFGYLLGRGDARRALVLQIFINGANAALTVLFGLVLHYGVAGIALGTALSEGLGLAACLLTVLPSLKGLPSPHWPEIFRKDRMAELLSLNRDIMIRSFVLIAAYTLMTRIGLALGTETQAANAVVMNIVMLSSFFLDGIATAAEQLTGRALGAGWEQGFRQAYRLTLFWSVMLGLAAFVLFLVGGKGLIALMTSTETVRAAALPVLPFAAGTALTGLLAFLLDGVFIGATWSTDMRNRMLLAFVAYLAALTLFVPTLGNIGLWIAFNTFLAMRGLLLQLVLDRRIVQSFRPAQ